MKEENTVQQLKLFFTTVVLYILLSASLKIAENKDLVINEGTLIFTFISAMSLGAIVLLLRLIHKTLK